jgi:hypothetical protein
MCTTWDIAAVCKAESRGTIGVQRARGARFHVSM